MTDQYDNTFQNGSLDNDNGSQEYMQPQQLPYDGANVTSSHPFDNAFNAVNNTEPLNEESNENGKPEAEQKEEPQPALDPKIDQLTSQNKQLIAQISKYEALLGQLFNAQPDNKQQNIKNLSPEEQKLHEYYHKGKQDAVIESLKQIEMQRANESKINELRSKNPDIASDPNKEELVGSIAVKYINQGYDFETSVNKAIADFRKVFNKNDNIVNKNITQESSHNRHNIPQNRSSMKNHSPKSLYIEGASPSAPETQFKASELIDMQINRPDEYLRLQPQIMKAYKQGKVVFD